MVSQRGIEVNPEKLNAIEERWSPTCHKEVQVTKYTPNGSREIPIEVWRNVIALLSNSLRKQDFDWTPKCEKTFQSLKHHLKTLQPMGKPMAGDAIYLYLSITWVVARSVSDKEENRAQVPVYFASKLFNQVKMKYLEIENYLYTLIISGRNLRPYFHVHDVTILTNQPLKQFYKN